MLLLMFIMVPVLRSRIDGNTALMVRRVPMKFVLKISRTSSKLERPIYVSINIHGGNDHAAITPGNSMIKGYFHLALRDVLNSREYSISCIIDQYIHLAMLRQYCLNSGLCVLAGDVELRPDTSEGFKFVPLGRVLGLAAVAGDDLVAGCEGALGHLEPDAARGSCDKPDLRLRHSCERCERCEEVVE